ncbi:MAG: bifunctional diaminohydroxyphosphoribosylaminopyrimidine deaminase/5-amino-6-(5-phosphoribosylamino)uracil reductase RibD [Clostridiaceae bacterium]
MDIEMMKRALKLAEKGTGYTNPNPLVGAVIVKNGKIIGEGFHKLYGSDHAEVDAFKNATENVRGADMYVTLEPCSHYGKTPPCANAIVEKGIKRVFIGLEDPNPKVSGKGTKLLRDNGIEVVTGILEEEGRKLNEIFLKYITTGLPFCIMKTAMTLDGKIATAAGDSKWITGELSRKHVHKLRHRVAGIMAGIGTVIADNPLLTTRLGNGEGKDPVRIIIDSSARIPLDAKVLNLDSKAATIIAVTGKAGKEKIKALENMGAEVIITPTKDGGVDLNYLMKKLGELKIDSVLLEGGSKLNYSSLKCGIVDKVNVFIAPKIIGGDNAKTPVGGEGVRWMRDAILLKDMEFHRFGDDIMIEGYIGKEGDS